jgi:hypothetical protein
MDGLFVLLGATFGLVVIAGVVNELLERFPLTTKSVLALLVFAYVGTVLVMCVNGDFRVQHWDDEEEPYCPGPPHAIC